MDMLSLITHINGHVDLIIPINGHVEPNYPI